MTAELEEIVVHADLPASQHLAPNLGEHFFLRITRRHVVGRGTRVGISRGGQRRAVELAGGGHRQTVEPDEGSRQHVPGKSLFEESAQLGSEPRSAAPHRLGHRRHRRRGHVLRPSGIEVPERRCSESCIPGRHHCETRIFEQGADRLQPASDVVDLGHHLADLGPVVSRDPAEHLELAFLDVDLEQVDPLHRLAANHVRQGAQLDGESFPPHPLLQELFELRG